MNNIEKEIRLKIDNELIDKIKNITLPHKEQYHMIDITLGKYGFESLNKTGYICRVRCKNDKFFIEVKKYLNNDECIEKSIAVPSLEDGISIFNLLGYDIYLILDRYREIRKYNDLLIYIDIFEDLGSYIEIEYQNSSKEEAYNFIDRLQLNLELQEKYGDIVYKKIKEDDVYKKIYINKINSYKNK